MRYIALAAALIAGTAAAASLVTVDPVTTRTDGTDTQGAISYSWYLNDELLQSTDAPELVFDTLTTIGTLCATATEDHENLRMTSARSCIELRSQPSAPQFRTFVMTR